MQNFRTPIWLLAQNMTNQNNEQVLVPTNRNDRLVAARVYNFFRIILLKFLGSQVGKDPQKFIDKVKKIFCVMSVSGSDR